ncbi:MAG: peptidoglycan-binding protein [Phyllobacterium sp.]|uniref:peptidoglycan-binding protein n=1 Tax=Phyllobacterium sp. TaxID=1871046 RepID=UPI0030EFE7C8
MTNQRSLMEQVNVNRARRDATSLDSLNRTLETLESQLRSAMKPDIPEENQDIADRFVALASRAGQPATPRHAAMQSEPSPANQRPGAKHDLSAIAAQLKHLRDEMRGEIEAPARGQYEPYRDAMHDLRQSTASDAHPANHSKTDSAHLSMLRGDLDELKRTVDTLTREEPVKSLGNRWDAMDERFDTYHRQPFKSGETGASLETIEGRLDGIRQAVEVLPHSLPLHNVEDKLVLLTGAVEQMSRKQGASLPAKFMQQVDERLDEISRAIVATSRPASMQYAEADAFERVEARIASLASKIESATYDRTSDTILKRMGELAQRVDQLTEQSKAPAFNLDLLSEQLAAVTRHLQNAPASISISDFRDLEDRVLQIIRKLETMPEPATADPAFIARIDQRFEELTRRLDDHHMMAEHSDIRLTDNLEARFDDMARYIAQNVPQADGTQDAIRNLELQIAGLAEHLSQSNDRHAEMAAIPPRLDAIEASIAANRDLVVEAARNAAAEAIRNTTNFGSDHDSAIARELADDLKTLEMLARKSEERNTKTFEAIHDTLLKIVDRLASLESGPAPVYRPRDAAAGTTFIADEPKMKATLAYDHAIDVEPAFNAPIVSKDENMSPEVALPHAAESSESAPREKKSLFGSLKRGLKGRGKHEAAQDPDMDTADEAEQSDANADLDPNILNRPLEPGSGMPDLNSILKRVRDDRREMPLAGETSAGKADFIAAARRAAQAAASEVENQKRAAPLISEKADGGKGSLFLRQRKPILLAIGAIMIAIAGLQLKNAFLDHSAGLDSQAQPTAPEPTPSAQFAAKEPALPAEPSMPAMAAQSAAPAEDSMPADATAAKDTVANVINSQQVTPPATDTSSAATSADANASTTALPFIPVEAGPEPLRDAAAKGDSKALFEIGDRYMDGRGVTSDYAKAAEWYNLSAQRGFAPAQYRLGNFYEKGLGVARDLAKAKTYYQLSAEQGNASAMHNLAVLFAAGIDGAPDNESAARWFSQAAELGVKDSQFNLAILSAKGMGVPQSLEESYKWFALAANAGDKDAAQKRDEVAKAMTPDQLERARAATQLWKPKPLNPDANALSVPEEWRVSPAATGSVTTGSIDMEKAIRNVQLILNKSGYDAGGSDGKISAKTRDAIMAFQKDNGLKPTGNIDRNLVRSLLQKNKQI